MSNIGSTTKKAVAIAAAATMTAGVMPATAFADEPALEEIALSSDSTTPPAAPETLPAQNLPQNDAGAANEQPAEDGEQQDKPAQPEQPAEDPEDGNSKPAQGEEPANPGEPVVCEDAPADDQDDVNVQAAAAASSEQELKDAIAAASAGDTIELAGDIELTSQLAIAKDITIKGSGHAITCSVSQAIVVNGTNLKLDGVAVSGTTIAIRANAGSTIDFMDGTSVSGGNYIVAAVGGTLNFESGSSVSSTSGEAVLAQSSGTVNVAAGATVSGSKTGVSVLSGSTANISGTVKATGSEGFGIASLGTHSNTSINVFAGADVYGAEHGIYNPAMQSTVSVSGGTITGGLTGIEMRGGDLAVSGSPTIESQASEYSTRTNANGTTILGAGIGVSQHSTYDAMNITISGTPTIKGPVAFAETATAGNTDEHLAKVSISIDGGTFISTTGGDAVVSDNKSGFITGGVFSSAPNTYLAEGVKVSENANGDFEVAVPSAENSVAGVIAADGTTVYYDDFADAIAAAKTAGQTVELYKDITVSNVIKPATNITLDLGGHTITSAYKGACLFNLAKNNMVVKNGTIDVAGSGTTYAMQITGNTLLEEITFNTGAKRAVNVVANKTTMSGCTINSALVGTAHAINVGYKSYPGRASLDMVGSTMTNAAGAQYDGIAVQLQYGAKMSMDTDSSIDMATGAGIYALDDSVLDVAGTIHSGDYFGVFNWGAAAQSPTINILDGAKIETEGNGAAVYLPAADGKCTIGKATISGVDGVNIRGGELTVNGADITSTAPSLLEVSGSASGSVNAGAAIAVIPHTHNGNISLVVNSGTFTGPACVYESNPHASTGTTEMSLVGGVYKSTIGGTPVISDNVSDFISGGNYSSYEMAKYVVPGYGVIDNGSVAGTPYVLGTDEELNDAACGYIPVGERKAYFTTPEALAKAADEAGVEAVATKRTIVFVDRDGNTVKEVEVDWNTGVPASEIPELSEDQLSYTDDAGRVHEFTGWSVNPTGPFTEDTEIAPTYGEKMTYSSITFRNGITGEDIAAVSAPNTYELDNALIPNPEPTIEVDGKTYKFVGWDEEPAGYVVDGDKVFTANYELADDGQGGETPGGDDNKPENPDNPGTDEPGDGSDGEGDDAQGGNQSGNDGSSDNRIENIKDDPTALCEPDEADKLHQTGDEIPYVVGGGILAALVAAIAVARKKFQQ